MKHYTMTLYRYDELNVVAKAAARFAMYHCVKETGLTAELSEIYTDIVESAQRFGLEIGTDGGSGAYCIYHSIHGSVWDRLTYIGTYSYVEGAVEAVKEYAPLDTQLHQIAQALTDLQTAYSNTISATVYGGDTLSIIQVESVSSGDGDNGEWDEPLDSDDATELEACFLDFAEWARHLMREVYSYHLSNKGIEERIIEQDGLYTRTGQVVTEEFLTSVDAKEINP